MSTPATLLWLRTDLRLDDHRALVAAVERGGPVVPVFVWAPDEEAPWSPGAAQRVWLDRSLRSLASDLESAGSRLIVRAGDSLETLSGLVDETGATAVHWTRRYEPRIVERDAKVERALAKRGIEVRIFGGGLLREPSAVATGEGNPYQVFTPFSKNYLRGDWRPDDPLDRPRAIPAPDAWPERTPVDDLHLRSTLDWDEGILEAWTPGESAAWGRLGAFEQHHLAGYDEGRDLPAEDRTSRLSPHLHHGEISVRRIWTRLAGSPGAEPYLRELVWRDFAHHVLAHFPHTDVEPLRPKYADFPWRDDGEALERWRRGRTGYPMVDAGMRQLWTTGWMHNRVRMVVGSFLVKHLLLPWQAGARWFWDTLVDADLASNSLGWQWAAGCGADAAPYFRIFNPMRQGERFDARGDYVRRWVPELADLPSRHVHAPWEASDSVLEAADVRIGLTYPSPIVDHRQARERALSALDAIG